MALYEYGRPDNFEEIPTPYDSILFALNEKLNSTYIAYGTRGAQASAMQTTMDTQNYGLSKSAAAKRVEVKGKKELYRNDDFYIRVFKDI